VTLIARGGGHYMIRRLAARCCAVVTRSARTRRYTGMAECCRQPGRSTVTLVARSRGLNVIGRFATCLRAVMTRTAGAG